MNTHNTTCYECGGEISPLAKTCPSCGAPLPFGPQLPANFHVARNGKRFGPYTEFMARNYLAQGSIRSDDLCWQLAMATWLPVSAVLRPRPAMQPSLEARLAQLCRDTPAPTLPRERRPQPIDYGLTKDDLNLYAYGGSRKHWDCKLKDGSVVQCFGPRDDDEYKKGGRWFGWLTPTNWIVGEGKAAKAGAWAFWLLLFGIPAAFSNDARILGLSLVGVALVCVARAIVPGMVIKRLRKRASPALEKYWQVLNAYDVNKRAAEQAARQAAHDAEMRKRSYWTLLDGYAFETATAEVLNKHQFNAVVTPGSGDGGIDIQVTRNGLRGVVQCKAHMARCGPHVVRDLYGVINHTRAGFGIIVSLGGFSKGAADFARDKPILFVNLDDLIAMQEGKDVLAAAFAPDNATARQQ